MRHIMIDFNASPIEAGYLGEHNATELVIVKPVDVIGAMYSVAFMTNGEVIHSKFFGADEEIRVALWQQLTQDNDLYVQLEAYDENGDYLGKSATVKLLLLNSVHGIDVIADADNPDVYSEIAQNSLFRETLEDNVDTLDKLTTSSTGKLLFNGKLIESAGGGSTEGGEISSELVEQIEANTENRHWHNNKENVLDYFGINYAKTRPTFKGDSSGAMNVIAFQDDITVRTGTLRQQLQEQIAKIPKFSVEVVDALPETDISETAVYLVRDNETDGNLYTEYIYVGGVWEKLGAQSVDVDLTEYAKVEDIPTKTSQLENDSGFITADDIPEGGTSDYISRYSEGSEVVTETDDEQRVIDAYQNMMSECMGDSEKIPFLLQTDNHNYFPKGIYNLCAKMINFAQFSQFLTLGDIAGNYFHETHLQNFVDAMKVFPIEKKTAIAGNHDVWAGASDRSYIDQSKLSKYLKNYTLRRYGTNGYGVLTDDYFNMKYLIISNYDKDEGESGSQISTKQVNFIVDELSKRDGYDVVILSHEPISLSDSTTTALLEAGVYTTMGNYFSFIPTKGGFVSMLLARKNKSNGTYTDDEGIEHTYDFTECNSDLLCCFCGHTHVEGFDFINGELLNVAFGGINHADGHPIYFGYIDKKNRLLKYYRAAGDYSSSVTVGLDKVNATDMTLNKTEIAMNVGELEVISPIFTPVTAGNQRVVWTSSNNAVATVTKGFVSGIAEGTATITAVSEDGNFTATCSVTVGAPEEPEEPDIPDVPDEPDVPDKPASNLPAEYQEVEYLYTNDRDVAHIPTVTSFAVGDKGYITAEYTRLYSTDTAICGTQTFAEIYVTGSGKQFKHYAKVTLVNPTDGTPAEENKVYNVEFDFTGVVSNLALMSYNNNGKYGMHGKFYSASFYRGDMLIYNFVPCYRKADGKIGMYDTVNNVFAEGVGELFKGEDV